MNLDPHGREFYDLTIITDPAVDAWEASFDGGTTWGSGEDVTPVDAAEGELRVRWLVEGAAVEPADHDASATVLSAPVTPLLRATDNPEIPVRDGPRISVGR